MTLAPNPLQQTVWRTLAAAALLAVGLTGHAQDTAEGRSGVLVAGPDSVVTQEDFDRYLVYRFPEQDPESALARPGAVRAAIESIYTIRLIANVARAEATAEQIAQAEWDAQYQRDRSIMSRYVSDKVQERLDEIDFSALAREQYEQTPERFMTAERRSAAHILIDTTQRTIEEAQALTDEVLAELESGRPFAEVATEYSEDPSVESNAGDLGMFARGQMVKPFEEAVFAMEVGDLSEPVQTRYGFHVIRLTGVEPARQQAFEEVELSLVAQLRAQRQPSVRTDLIEELKAESVAKGVLSDREAIEALEASYLEGTRSIP